MASPTPTKILVYGSNLDAWLTLVGLRKLLQFQLKQNLVELHLLVPSETDNHKCIAGHPADKRFFETLGLPEAQLFASCKAQYSLGNAYLKHAQEGMGFQPYGASGFTFQGLSFLQVWSRLTFSQNNAPAYSDFSPAAVCAQNGRFCHPPKDTKNLLASMDYAINIEAESLIKVLKASINTQSVSYGNVVAVVCNEADRNHLSALKTDKNEQFAADLFIDVSQTGALHTILAEQGDLDGNNAQESSKSPKSSESSKSSKSKEWQSVWAKAPLDTDPNSPVSAYVMRTKVAGKKVTGEKAETHWERHSEVYGEKYFAAFAQENLNTDALLEQWQHTDKAAAIVEKTSVKNTAPAQSWTGNVVALGRALYPEALAFLSPIFLLHKQLQHLLPLIPGTTDTHLCAQEYNRFYTHFIKNLQELCELHSLFPFNAEGPIGEGSSPDLQHRLQLFQERARVAFDAQPLLQEEEWAALLLALGVTPQAYDPMLDKYHFDELQRKMLAGHTLLKQMAAKVPPLGLYRARLLQQLQAQHS